MKLYVEEELNNRDKLHFKILGAIYIGCPLVMLVLTLAYELSK